MTQPRRSLSLPWHLLRVSVALQSFLLLSTSAVWAQRFDCVAPHNCVYRPSFRIRAMVHGTYNDTFWLQVQAAMFQAAKDMNVDFQMNLYDIFDSQVMANDINSVAEALLYGPSSEWKPDALIVSVPDAIVQNAVGNLIQDTKLPVFGINSGASVGLLAMGMLGFVSMNDFQAGRAVGGYWIGRNVTSNKKGLFVNHDYFNVALEARFLGIQSMLGSANNITMLTVDGNDEQNMIETFYTALQGCPFSFIQLAGAIPVPAMLQAMEANKCSYETTVIGAFETNEIIFNSLRNGKLQFSVSQQKYMEASMPVVMATLYLTTGQHFPVSSQSVGGEYLSGPILITKEELPDKRALTCAVDAFPVCPNDTAANGAVSTCPCINRRSITIAGITHGNNAFWDPVFAAMQQASHDFDINLHLVKLSLNLTEASIYPKMISQIREFCSPPYKFNGIFVSLPNKQVAAALPACIEAGIPVVVINAGANYAAALGVPFIGQAEFTAGEQAGKQLIAAGVKKGICLMSDGNITSLQDRCRGVQYAFEVGNNVEFLGAIVTPSTGPDFVRAVENAVGEQDAWSGVGAITCGTDQIPFILDVLDKHPLLTIGTFDTAPEVYSAMDEGKVLFGIDQNSYLQGYWPIPLLTWNLTTNQSLLNSILESGPQMYTSSPINAKLACQNVLFAVCPDGTFYDGYYSNSAGESYLSPGGIAGVVVASIALVAFVVFLFYKDYLNAAAEEADALVKASKRTKKRQVSFFDLEDSSHDGIN